MGITPPPPSAAPGHAPKGVLAGGLACGVLFVLGLAEGVVGSFQYSRGGAGTVPAGALGFCAGILLTCALCGWALRALPGALLPALGWLVASFGLAMPNAGGSVIIADTTAGQWYLYGGTVCSLLGLAAAVVFTGRGRSRSALIGGGGYRA